MARSLTVTAALVAALAFPAQASADHVACGDTITASTTLDADLVDCPGSGIIVGADNITLDLNRRTISGSDTTILGYPAIVLSGENATVRGTVRGFNAGLEISGNDNLIRNVSASNNDLGICICAGTGMRGNRFESSVISDNEGGIFLSDAGGSLTPGTSSAGAQSSGTHLLARSSPTTRASYATGWRATVWTGS